MESKQLIQALQERGHRVTHVRSKMIELFVKHHAPLSAEELLKQIPDTHKTTVYRELAFLEEQNIVKKIEFGDGIRRYELTELEHHHHLVCVSCKKVTDIHLEGDLDVEEKKISRKTGFKILNHSLEFFGMCPKCK